MINPAIKINAQYLKDLSFENPKILDILSKPPENPPVYAIQVEINVKHMGDTTFEVTLNLHVDTRAKADAEPLSIMEVAYAGVFTLPAAMKEDEIKAAILVDCPSFLFPFVRALVVDVTRESGVMPLTLAPIDFYALYQQKFPQQSNKDAPEGDKPTQAPEGQKATDQGPSDKTRADKKQTSAQSSPKAGATPKASGSANSLNGVASKKP